MKKVAFTKMTGAGNDFVVIDNFTAKNKYTRAQIEKICSRGFGVGADGLMLLNRPVNKKYSFNMRYYNSDGREAEMCGNGGRCIAKFAYLNKRAGRKMLFMAKDGEHEAEIKKDGTVKLGMIDPFSIKAKVDALGDNIRAAYANTGVPHLVVFVKDIKKVNVDVLGRRLRFHKKFKPKGANVNFVKVCSKNAIEMRTYERGVEGETLACGTGAVAAAVLSHALNKATSPVKVSVPGGKLKVYFKENAGKYTDVYLEGPAVLVFKAEIL